MNLLGKLGGIRFDTSSFSDDQSNNLRKRSPHSPTKQQRKNSNHNNHNNPMHSSSFSPFYNTNHLHNNAHYIGHRQSSSFDTAMIDTNENFLIQQQKHQNDETTAAIEVSDMLYIYILFYTHIYLKNGCSVLTKT